MKRKVICTCSVPSTHHVTPRCRGDHLAFGSGHGRPTASDGQSLTHFLGNQTQGNWPNQPNAHSIYTIKQSLKHLTDRSIRDSGGVSVSLLGKGPVLVKNVFGTSNRQPNQEWFNQIRVCCPCVMRSVLGAEDRARGYRTASQQTLLPPSHPVLVFIAL